jgi:hypothetical protein
MLALDLALAPLQFFGSLLTVFAVLNLLGLLANRPEPSRVPAAGARWLHRLLQPAT